MEITCKTNDTLPLSALTEFQGGLKKRTEDDYNKIIKSINKYGFAFPFFVWQHDGINHVLDGHGRLGALQRMTDAGESIPDLPVVFVNAKDEADAKNLLLRLNSTYGEMTAESVVAFLDGLEIDFDDVKLPDGILDLSTVIDDEDTKDDDEAPLVDTGIQANSKAGEVYELGEHRLICGDCTNANTLAALMAGAKADLLLTDPPYNVDYAGKTQEKLKIHNDRKNDFEMKRFLITAFHTMFDATKAGAAFYIFYAQLNGDVFINALKEAGYKPHQCLVWVKNVFTFSRADYKWRHEPILYGWKDGASHNFYGALNDSTVFDKKKNIEKMTKDELKAELKRIENAIPQDIIYEKKPPRNSEHPTMKPVEILARLIKNSTKSDDIVLDPFGGSGSTLIAAEKTGRIARLCELDPHYCDVIRKRWTKWAKENDCAVGTGGLE